MNKFGVIIAGGGGTRFWPLSRQRRPKQLINLSGSDIMVNEAIGRMSTVVDKENIFIVTSEKQYDSMLEATNGKVYEGNIISEPEARNTAACIGLAAIEILKKYGDGIMIITPADHYIKDIPTLSKTFEHAVEVASSNDKLITIGINPSFPSTGFGYIKYDSNSLDLAKPVLEFKEKPTESKAKEYIENGYYLWNSGMFIWKASLILKKFKELVPDIYSNLIEISKAINTEKESEALHSIYPKIRSISIDYAIMEPSSKFGDVLVIPSDFGWNDVGSWDMMDVIHQPDENGNVFVGDVIGIDSRNNVAFSSSRIITLLDVENVVVVETEDAIMVCSKDKAQNVKRIVDKLKEDNRNHLL